MKRSIKLACAALIPIGVSAFLFLNYGFSEPASANPCETANIPDHGPGCCVKPLPSLLDNFGFGVGSRFNATVSRDDILNARVANDLLPAEAGWSAYPVQSLTVTLLRGIEISESGMDLTLTQPQRELLASLEYSQDFRLVAPFVGKQGGIAQEEQDLVYYITVVPEVEADYPGGTSALVRYLQEGSTELIQSTPGEVLQSGRLRFIIDTDGSVKDVTTDSSCGYQVIDERMIELITSLPERFTPAADANGNNVEQELVFLYGMIGC